MTALAGVDEDFAGDVHQRECSSSWAVFNWGNCKESYETRVKTRETGRKGESGGVVRAYLSVGQGTEGQCGTCW
jgi:hypothetical protein